jgi:molybdopterin converting factor small subunit
MSVTILVPGPLRRYCGNVSKLETSTRPRCARALEDLEQRLPTLHRGIRDETGRCAATSTSSIKPTTCAIARGWTPLSFPGDELIIMPAVSGG